MVDGIGPAGPANDQNANAPTTGVSSASSNTPPAKPPIDLNVTTPVVADAAMPASVPTPPPLPVMPADPVPQPAPVVPTNPPVVVPPPAPAPAPVAPAPTADPLAGWHTNNAPAPSTTPVQQVAAPAAPIGRVPNQRRKLIVIGILALVLVLGSGGVLFVLTRTNGDEAGQQEQPTNESPQVSSPSPTPTSSPSEAPSPSPSPSNSPAAVDTTAPSAPKVLTIGGNRISEEEDTASTSQNRPVIAGTAEANSKINVSVQPNSLSFVTAADSNGAWAVTPDVDIPNGEATLSITATDAAGNASPATTLVLDINSSPAAPAITQGLAPTGESTWLINLLGFLLMIGSLITLGWIRRHART